MPDVKARAELDTEQFVRDVERRHHRDALGAHHFSRLVDLVHLGVEIRVRLATMFQNSSYVKQVGRVLQVIHYLVVLASSRILQSRAAPSRMRGVWRSIRAAGMRWSCVVTG